MTRTRRQRREGSRCQMRLTTTAAARRSAMIDGTRRRKPVWIDQPRPRHPYASPCLTPRRHHMATMGARRRATE